MNAQRQGNEDSDARQAYLKARLGLHLPIISKTGQTPQYAYARLPDILTAIGPALREAGFVVRFSTWSPDAETLGIRCTLTHVEGHSESSEMLVAPAKLGMTRQNEMQVRGSAITYGCRYCLLCLLGTAPEVDDDAQTDTPRPQREGRETPYARQKREEAEKSAEDDCPF